MDAVTIKPIGRIYTVFPEKFGIPRQSGIVDTPGTIVLDEPYNDPNAIRGLEDFSYVWILWQVSGVLEEGAQWSPTVRPPRLGGNRRVGVFATRSPYHPNAIGLSCLKLEGIEESKDGPLIHVSGADIMDGTPIYDIKPYVTAGDCRPDAKNGFVDTIENDRLEVAFADGIDLPATDTKAIKELIACDPRPRYQSAADREYGMRYKGWNIKFTVNEGLASVFAAEKENTCEN